MNKQFKVEFVTNENIKTNFLKKYNVILYEEQINNIKELMDKYDYTMEMLFFLIDNYPGLAANDFKKIEIIVFGFHRGNVRTMQDLQKVFV